MSKTKINVINTFKNKEKDLKIAYTQKWIEFLNRKESDIQQSKNLYKSILEEMNASESRYILPFIRGG